MFHVPTNKSDWLKCIYIEINLLLFQAYGFLEFFCGEAWISRVMRAEGVQTASFDINLGRPEHDKQNAMNLLTCAGFGSLQPVFRTVVFMFAPNAYEHSTVAFLMIESQVGIAINIECNHG